MRARLPGRLRPPHQRRKWQGLPASRRSRASGNARISVRQSRPLSGTRIFARTAALSASARGRQSEGHFARISWDEALDEIAARLKTISAESGSEAILPYSYGGSMGFLQGSGMDRRFFHRLGASRLDRTICSAAGGVGLVEATGFKYGTEPEQFRHSRLILAWGANILGTNVHLWPFIVEARRQGARFYTIDPHRNRTGLASDKHFFINPGTDTALALGMMHVIVAEKLYDAEYVERHTSGFDELARKVHAWTPERA